MESDANADRLTLWHYVTDLIWTRQTSITAETDQFVNTPSYRLTNGEEFQVYCVI